MAIRKVITERQRLAANLILAQGLSATRALRQAGFGKAYARNLGRALKRSWGLREAFREQSEQLQWSPRLRKLRTQRYDKRRTAYAIRDLALAGEMEPAPSEFRPPRLAEQRHDIDKRLRPPKKRCLACGALTDRLEFAIVDLGSGSVPAYVCSSCAQNRAFEDSEE